MDNTGQKQFEKIAGKRAVPYISTFMDYLGYIQSGLQNKKVNGRYLFNILRDIGYIYMMGAGLESIEKGFTVIRTILLNDNTSLSEDAAPDFIGFDELDNATEHYTRQQKDFIKTTPPKLDTGFERNQDLNMTKEEIWEDVWRESRQKGLGLILAGMDLVAVMIGHELVLKKDSPANKNWKKLWKSFTDNSKKYINKLLDNKESFYFLADDVCFYLRYFFKIPECPFRKLLLNISSPRSTYAQENNYRMILSPEEIEDIYFRIKLKFQDESFTKRIYLYENALAQEMLKTLILRTCCTEMENSTVKRSNWQLQTTLDENFDCEVPMIAAGEDTTYSVHMLKTYNTKVSGWGLRKDRMKPFLSTTDNYFKGALFCSWKEYPTSEILVRFENYIGIKDLRGLIDNKQECENGFENFIKFNLADVYSTDNRETFLKNAAVAVMGITENTKIDINPLACDNNDIEEMLKLLQLRYITIVSIIASHRFGRASLRAHGADDAATEVKIIQDVVIENLKQWDTVLKPYTNIIQDEQSRQDMSNFLTEIKQMASGSYQCGVVVLYTDGKIENLGTTSIKIKENRRGSSIEIDLQSTIESRPKENFGIIFVGVSNEENRLKQDIEELCKTVEEKRQFKNAKIPTTKTPVIWIRYIFKCNIKKDPK